MTVLTTWDKGRIGYTTLRELPGDYAREVAFEALDGAGYPGATFLDPASDAKWWAACATPDELGAYLAAGFLALPRTRRRRFLEWGARQ